MTARALPEDSPPSAFIQRDPSKMPTLRFPGGEVRVAGFVQSHNVPTPSTLSTPEQRAEAVRGLILDELADATAFIADARKLIEQGRRDDARFELQMAARHIENAKRWCEP